VKVKPISPDPQALLGSRRWHLLPPAPGLVRPASKPGMPAYAVPSILKVTGVRVQGDHVVAMVQDLNDRDAAQALKGARIFVSRASFPSTDPDEFYWVDLIGLAVSNRQGAALGDVIGLLETGPHCVLRIAPPGGGEELLIPFVGVYVDEVDLATQRLRVDWEIDPEVDPGDVVGDAL